MIFCGVFNIVYIFCSIFSRILQAIWYIISNKYLVILTWFFSDINAKMIDVQTRPIFLEGPGETFNWIFCGLYLYVSISQLLKNSVWLGLKLLRGRSLITLSKFWPLLTTYPPLVDIGDRNSSLLQGKICTSLIFPVPPTSKGSSDLLRFKESTSLHRKFEFWLDV